MMCRLLGYASLVIAATMPAARAYDFPPVPSLDLKEIEPAMQADLYGAWEIRNKSGSKKCRIVLSKETTIGGNALEVPPNCAKLFPVMADITAWRLQEMWTIDMADALRKTRLRFSTPDERYIVVGDKKDVGDMDELLKVTDTKPAKRK